MKPRRFVDAGDQHRQREERVEQGLELEEAEELQVESAFIVAAAAPVFAQLLIATFFGLADDAFAEMPSKPQSMRSEHCGNQRAAWQIPGRERGIQHGQHREIHRPADIHVTEVVVADAEPPEREHDRDHDERADEEQQPDVADHGVALPAATGRRNLAARASSGLNAR